MYFQGQHRKTNSKGRRAGGIRTQHNFCHSGHNQSREKSVSIHSFSMKIYVHFYLFYSVFTPYWVCFSSKTYLSTVIPVLLFLLHIFVNMFRCLKSIVDDVNKIYWCTMMRQDEIRWENVSIHVSPECLTAAQENGECVKTLWWLNDVD